ncbi:MAG: 7-cyano-7-deazaguanine synthase [Streptococcus salivarius]
MSYFAYGQRHSLEIEVAKEIARTRLNHHVLDMSCGQSENALTSDIELRQKKVKFNTLWTGVIIFFFAAVLAKQRGITDVTGVVRGLFWLSDCVMSSFVKS